MRPEQILVTSKNQTRIWVEGQETCREYYKTDKITFGMSELLPGAVGDLDPGHSEADEIFYCVQGEVLCYVPEDDTYYRLKEGDAMLIPPGKGHKLFNIGETKAIVTWSCAPHQ
ncbi:MAG: cupin domain-containing protein [Lachnospiraceae bacterium]|nr:cupin domain-containing protein [Lachnospiraceae bacterium]